MWKGFQKPKRLAVQPESLTGKFASFSAQPFERGFGTTIGSLLRRALLGSIEGAAITAVKIKGVADEFTPVPGVAEDPTDILLNLKQIPLKMLAEGPATLRLKADKPGPVFSSEIETDSDVEILDGSIHVATVEKGGSLDIEMRVKLGRGYVSAENNFDDVGYIPIDSVHSPVRKVNFSVDQARLGQMTDYDKLSLEVFTNGAVTPQDAIAASAKLIREHMNIFINFEEEAIVEEAPVETDVERFNEHLNRSVEELELSVRSYNCLKNANIQTIGDLVVRSEADMLKTKNFGRKSLNEIKDILGTMGLGPRHAVRRRRATDPGRRRGIGELEARPVNRASASAAR